MQNVMKPLFYHILNFFYFFAFLNAAALAKDFGGKFFASSDQEKTLVFLNHTLLVETVSSNRKHVQIKQDDFDFLEGNEDQSTPLDGILYGNYSIVSKNMTLFFHAINSNSSYLSYLFHSNLSEQCADNYTKSIESDRNISLESDYIVISRIFGKALFVKTNKNFFIIDLEVLISSGLNLIRSSASAQIIPYEQQKLSMIPFQLEQVERSTNRLDIRLFELDKQQYFHVLDNNSLRNQVWLPISIKSNFTLLIEQCSEPYDFDMISNKHTPFLEQTYFIFKCGFSIQIFQVSPQQVLQLVHKETNLPSFIAPTFNPYYLLSQQNEHVYALSTPNQVCFLAYQQTNNSTKFLKSHNLQSRNSLLQQQTQYLCMTNKLSDVQISHLLFNEMDDKATLVLSNTERDTKLFGQIIDKCQILGMKESISCDICQHCSNSCAFYLLDSCDSGFMLLRFNLLFVLLIILLFLILVALLKMLKRMLKQFFKMICTCIFFLYYKIPQITCKYSKKICLYTRFYCKKFGQKVTRCCRLVLNNNIILNEDKDDVCPICMESLSVRPQSKFVCQNHKAHTDCLEEYNNSKIANNQPLDCPFRDVYVAQSAELSASSL